MNTAPSDSCDTVKRGGDGTDEGVCVELRMAYIGKTHLKSPGFIVGFHSDIRASFIGGKLNPMLKMCFNTIVENEDELLQVPQKLKGNPVV